MASACIDEKDIRKYLEHIHPNLLSDVESYEVGVYYIFPAYHNCRYRNRNGTGKKIEYNREKSVFFLFILLVGEILKRNI